MGTSEIDTILSKFDLVMRKKTEKNGSDSKSQILGEVIDVPTLN